MHASVQSPEQNLLSLLKEKSNYLNESFQHFQAEIKCIIHQIMDKETNDDIKSMYNDKINTLFNDYSFSINRLEIEYLIKCEHANKPPKSLSIKASPKTEKVRNNNYETRFDDDYSDNESSSSEYFDIKYKHKCDECDISYTRLSSLERHNRKCHPEPANNNTQRATTKHACEVCLRTFKTAAALGSHIIVHKESKRVKCEICGESFKNRQGLGGHKTKHRNNAKECDICGETFKNGQALGGHMSKHRNNNDKSKNISRIECNDCDETCNDKLKLNRHRNAVHAVMHQNPFKCDICDRVYASDEELRIHTLTHDDLDVQTEVQNSEILDDASFGKTDDLIEMKNETSSRIDDEQKGMIECSECTKEYHCYGLKLNKTWKCALCRIKEPFSSMITSNSSVERATTMPQNST